MVRLVLCTLLIATPAWADLIDPEVESCNGAEEGSACELSDGSSGTCQPGQCCRLDYSTDASTPPEVCSDCLRCAAAMAPAGGQMAGGSPASGGSAAPGGSPASGGQPAAAGAPSAGEMGGGGESKTGDDEDESGCSAGISSEEHIGFVAALFGFLLAVRLRRSR